MTKAGTHGLALLLSLSLLACGGDDIADDGGTATFATYNAGLARGFVPLAEERSAVTAEAIANLQADVVCVQEVWLEEDVTALTTAAADSFPTAIFREPDPGEVAEEPACTNEEAGPLETCARANCGDVSNDDLAGCVLGMCGPEYEATSDTCQGCLAANIGGSLDDILMACALGGGSYAYGGSFGIGLLTDGEILEQDALVFESTLNRRAVQHARIALPAATVDVFCTHLSAVFDDIPYPGEAESWEAEQAAQIDAMRLFINEHAGAGGGVVLMGDFNTGPAIGDLAGEVPDNYAALVSGYDNPYLEQASPACTFCAENPLVGGADDDDSVAIDHVLLRDLPGEVVSTERILTEPVTVQGADGPVPTAYSDHFGVAATVSFSAD